METQEVIDLMQRAFTVALLLNLPVLGTALIVGIFVSLFQTITSIQEQTLVFVPKILGAIGALIVFFTFMLSTIMNFTISLIHMLPQIAQ